MRSQKIPGPSWLTSIPASGSAQKRHRAGNAFASLMHDEEPGVSEAGFSTEHIGKTTMRSRLLCRMPDKWKRRKIKGLRSHHVLVQCAFRLLLGHWCLELRGGLALPGSALDVFLLVPLQIAIMCSCLRKAGYPCSRRGRNAIRAVF